MGAALSVELGGAASSALVAITYRTSPGSTAVQWLRPEQTAGGVHPYLFTQCQVGVYTRPLFGLM